MTFFAHRITNAVSEGLNSKIQTIKQRATGRRVGRPRRGAALAVSRVRGRVGAV
jgi:hypothetical protein